MSPATITLIVIAVLLIGVIVALYFLGKKAQKKQAEQEEHIVEPYVAATQAVGTDVGIDH